MTDKWQSGKTYPPGSLVIPASQPAVDATSAENGDFAAGNSGWDYTGSCTFSSTGGYSNANCCIAPGVTAGGLALNKAKFLMSPGETISANCMIQQGASDVDHTRGYVQVLFFDASDAQIGQPVSGNIVNDGRGGAWHPSSVQATAPAGTSYARCGIYLYQNSADPIWGDNLVVTYARRKPPAGLIFKATQANPGKSAQTEPVWPTSTGVTVTDNEVTWEGVIATRLVWEASPILKSGATEPTWATSVGGAVHDGTIDWLAASRRVEDANCPNTKIVAIAAGKVYAADNDIIRYCATVNPLDWSATDDAGYLPFGLQTYGSNPIAAMGLYRSNLVAFNSEGFQMWQVDPDPASITLLDALPVASTHNKALAPVANDLLFLSSLGVRSIGIAASSVNLQAGDVGMPVDVLVRESIRIATANDSPVLATYYPGAGQYWLAVRALQPLVITGGLPDGRTGETANYQYDVGGGVLPRTVSIASGALPTGLSMDASGLVTGTRTTVASYAWMVRVTDADGSIVDLPDAAATTDTLSTAILADSPVGYWKADETSGTVMADSSGNGYHGTYTVAVGVTRGAPPLRAMATASLGSDGTAVGATVPYNVALDVAIGGTTAWAMECVVKKVSTKGAVWDQVFGAIGTTGGMGLRLFYRGTGRNFATGRCDAADIASPNSTSGSIVHLIFERDGSVSNLYENGMLVASGTGGAAQLYGDLQFLGTAAFLSSYAFNGFGSDFALYNHALGATRALAHAKAAGFA